MVSLILVRRHFLHVRQAHHLLVLALMAASLGNSSVEAQVSAQLARCYRATNFDTCLREPEKSVLKQHPGMAHRRGSALVLILASGDSVVLHDTSMAHPLPPMRKTISRPIGSRASTKQQAIS